MQRATSSPEATRQLAAELAALVQAGDLILLAGDLGAGKTAFSQGFGAALGVTQPITSPTFTLAQQYEGTSLRMHHLDVYRLGQLSEVTALGLPELLEDEAVVIIEWGDAIAPALPADYLQLTIRFGEGDDDRCFHCEVVGDRWSNRSTELEAVFAAEAEGSPTC